MLELIKIQGELDVPKGNYNSFGKYKYRSTEDILGAVKSLLTKYECFLTITDEIMLVGDRYYVRATATITKGEQSVSVSAYAREAEEQKGMNESQLTGSTSSYARKYALSGLFAIDDEKDADNTNTHEKEVVQEKKWFNFPDLQDAIIQGFNTDVALRQYIKDYGFTCSAPMGEVIKKYLATGDLEKPEFKK